MPDQPLTTLQLLGTPRLVDAAAKVRPLNRRDAALLALLAIEGPTSRARILSLLWPQGDVPTARNALRQRLFRLRDAAAAELVVPGELLDLAPCVSHDLGDPAPRLANDPNACVGDLLAGHEHDDLPEFAQWLALARARWRTRRADALAGASQALEQSGRLAEAIRLAQRLVHDEPLLEHAQRRLIRLHYRRGDRSAALAAFERYRQHLDEQIGETPSAETQALVALVEAGSALPVSAPQARAGALPSASPAPTPVALLRPPRLVGRDREWAALEAGWAAGATLLVSGEPGIGKTRLLGDFAATRGGCVQVSMRHGDAGVPWLMLGRTLRALCGADGPADAPWARAELARVVPEWGEALAGPVDLLRLQRAARHVVGTSPAEGIVIDDLQWADTASLDMLPALWAAPSPRWAMAVRAAELAPLVAGWQAALPAHEWRRVDLQPLDQAGVAALIESLALPELAAGDWAARLHRHTGGNPMFVLETLLALLRANPAEPTLPLPGTVLSTIQRRLALLSPPALNLARVAAVAGADFSVDIAAAVLAQPPIELIAPWRELEDAHIIVDAAFAHDLLLEATLQAIPAAIRTWLHQAIAQALEARADATAERVAGHWRDAGGWEQAGAAFTRAAQRAYGESRFGEAAGHFQAAADCHARHGDRVPQQRALQELIGCHIKHHDLVNARRAAQRLRALATDTGEIAWALDRLGDIANIGRDDAAAEAIAREMLALGRDAGEANGWITFNATRKLAVALAHLGRHDESAALFESQHEWVAANAAEWNVHVWLADRGYALELADRRSEALAAHDTAAQAARAHANWYVVYAALRNRGIARFWQGRLAAALADSDEALRLTDRIGDASVQANPREASRRATLLRQAGRHAESLALLERSVVQLAAGQSPFWLAHCQDQLALGYLAVGQHARAGALVQGDPGCDTAEAHATRWLVRARCARERPEPQRGAAVGAWFQRAECPARWRLLAQIEQAHALEAPDARALADAVAAEATHRDLGSIAMQAQLVAARAALDAGQADAGRAALEVALGAWRGACQPTGITPLGFLGAAIDALDALGARAEADRLLLEAVERMTKLELPHVPAPFRDSFLQRNPVHRRLFALARRLGSVTVR